MEQWVLKSKNKRMRDGGKVGWVQLGWMERTQQWATGATNFGTLNARNELLIKENLERGQ